MRSLVDIVADLADALDRLDLRFVLGGALATSFWGIARTTQDVDCLVSVSALKYQLLADAVQALGYEQQISDGSRVDPSVGLMRAQVADRKMMEFYCEAVRIELFVPVVPLQEEALRRAVTLQVGRRDAPVTSAEDMVLLKMAFHRAKDLQDVRGILWVQRGKLDLDYVRYWSARSHAKPVQRELDQLIAQYAGAE